MPFLTLFWGEGSPTKLGYREKGTLILTSLLEDLDMKPDKGRFERKMAFLPGSMLQ